MIKIPNFCPFCGKASLWKNNNKCLDKANYYECCLDSCKNGFYVGEVSK